MFNIKKVRKILSNERFRLFINTLKNIRINLFLFFISFTFSQKVVTCESTFIKIFK